MAAPDASNTTASADGADTAPLLSVTVLNYNYARYLPQCLDSILRQTTTDFELILINDRSTDDSLEVIQPYLADPRVKLVNHEHNKGYIASLIEGSDTSRGKYITVISADDYCVSDRAFETLVEMMEGDDRIGFAYSAHGYYTNDGQRPLVIRPYAESGIHSGVEEYRDLIMENHILHSGVIIRTSTYHTVGGYDPAVRYACDAKMWLVLCGQGSVAYSADELYAYRWHGSNMSDSPGAMRVGIKEHLDAIESTFVVMHHSPEISATLLRRAIRRHVRVTTLGKIFNGHVRLAWYALWCSARLHPLLAVFQRSTLEMFAYTLLGPHGFESLRALAGAAKARARHTLLGWSHKSHAA